MGNARRDAEAVQELRGTSAGHRFLKDMRLRRRSDFLEIQQTGKVVRGRHFLVIVSLTAPQSISRGRIGITVSKRVGKAVTRNRLKRLVREYARRHPSMTHGIDVVVVAKRSAATLQSYDEVAAELSSLQHRFGVRTRSRKSRC